jgi:hypothetical protein
MRSNFLGGAYSLRSLPLAAQTCVNLYLEPNESGTGEQGGFYGTPGLLKKETVATEGCRGLRAAGGYLWAVFGSAVYRVDSTFTATNVGTLPNSSGSVAMADNGTVLVIAHAEGWHSVNLSTSAFAAVSGAPTMSDVSFIDNYLVGATEDGTYTWANLNSTTIDALNFASAEGHPDHVVRTIADHRELWLFGSATIEVAVVGSDPDLPFTRVKFIEQGILAPHSAAKIDNTVYWVGANEEGERIVYRVEGETPIRVSTFAIEDALAASANPELATAYTYQQGGHHFYVLNLSEGTWVYDINTQLWHQRAYRNTTTGELERHRGEGHALYRGQHIVGDYADGRLYALDLNTFTDDGDEIYQERAWMQRADGRFMADFHYAQLYAEMGLGLDGAPQSDWADPQAWLSWSDDGGKTWNNEHARSLGRIGEFKKRAIWRRMGKSYKRIYRLRKTAATRTAWYGFEFQESA